MNLNNFSPTVRALVESLTEPASEEGFDIVDVDEDDDGVTVTFSRDSAFVGDDADEEEDDR